MKLMFLKTTVQEGKQVHEAAVIWELFRNGMDSWMFVGEGAQQEEFPEDELRGYILEKAPYVVGSHHEEGLQYKYTFMQVVLDYNGFLTILNDANRLPGKTYPHRATGARDPKELPPSDLRSLRKGE